ncbi:LysR family transcriptional regulator [Denitromonas iodatirespirans]|uniref:LysR family transcriptional regulator n=1 Tax=Denitromonas iodatirespirans TaxID=2795389 RepID=A0A944H5X1_DENI1|nr:LysR family transcriptional regulator [Denitromonas iodatirespirans]MBT0959558.1 LysR family transcriptional regulator [Denitromonas iodatirespirans]
MFEISQIRCFVAVAEELHFSRAAERLNMTQPPLSRQIRLLEHHVGTQLIERTSRSVRLTAAGRAFLPQAARILRMAEEAAATARRVAKGETGSLSIGFTAASGYGLLPQIVRRIRVHSPGISLTLKELVSRGQLEALAAGQLDLGLLRPHAEHGELEAISLAQESLVLAIPSREAAHWPERPVPADLNGRPFVMYSPYEAQYFYHLLQGIFDRSAASPDVVEYVAQMHTMLALVHSGIGAALIPEAATRLHFEGIVMRRLATDPPRPVETVCAYRKDNDNPVLGIFKTHILPGLNGH